MCGGRGVGKEGRNRGRRREYDNVELKIQVRRAMREAAALVRELDRLSEYSTAVGLPPSPEGNGSPDNGEKKDENEAGIISA